MTGLIFASSRITPRLVSRFGARPILLFGLFTLGVATLWISKARVRGYLESLFGPSCSSASGRFVLLAAQCHDLGESRALTLAPRPECSRPCNRPAPPSRRGPLQYRGGPRAIRRAPDGRGIITWHSSSPTSPSDRRGTSLEPEETPKRWSAGDGRIAGFPAVRRSVDVVIVQSPPDWEGLCNEIRSPRYRYEGNTRVAQCV